MDHIVLGQLLLEKRLRNGPSDPAAGEAFCITGGEALPSGHFLALAEVESERILGRKIHVGYVPGRIVYLIASAISLLQYVYPGNVDDLVGHTMGHVTQSTFLTAMADMAVKSDAKARTILGYKPHTSHRMAIRRTFEEYKLNKTVMDAGVDL